MLTDVYNGSQFRYNNTKGLKNINAANHLLKEVTNTESQADEEASLKDSNTNPARTRKKWPKDTVARMYTCEICLMTAKLTRPELNAHYDTHGNALGLKKFRKRPPKPGQLFVCEICSENFSSEENLDDHIVNHDDHYICDICEKGFKKIIDYTMHLQSHSDDKLYKCPLCDFNTPNAYHIKSHVLSHQVTKKYECPIEGCKKGFTQFSYFQEHKYYHTGEKPFTCETCGASFMYSRYLSSHKTRVHSPATQIPCEICSKICVGRRNFRLHSLVHKEPEWVCMTCGKTFKKRGGLKIHELTHAEDKPHKCNHCDKVFARKEYLNEHERIHTGYKPYECEHCGRKFSQRSSMVRHVRGHTGEKPHICRFCHKGFTAKATLTSHLKTCKGFYN